MINGQFHLMLCSGEIAHAVIDLDRADVSAGSQLKLGDMSESYTVMFNFSVPCLSLTYSGIKGSLFSALCRSKLVPDWDTRANDRNPVIPARV